MFSFIKEVSSERETEDLEKYFKLLDVRRYGDQKNKYR